jgi:membrane protein
MGASTKAGGEAMNSAISKLWAHLNAYVWEADLRSLRGPRRAAVRTLRLCYAIGRDLLGGELNLRAMSLVYTTLLAMVPLLAVIFSVLKAFGVHNQVEPLLRDFLVPLGPQGNDVAAKIVGFVENIQVGLLGSIGLGLLIYTAISLVQKIEAAFNFAWHVQSLRSFGRRLSSYLTVVLIGPVLVFSALGITTSVMNTSVMQGLAAIEPFGTLVAGLSKLIPYLLICAAFTFAYLLVPNTRVRIAPAAVGSLAAGILWQTIGWGFAAFIASSARYAAIYSSLAILILLLIWLYLNWLILLLGAQVSFYVQNPQYLTMKPIRLALSNRLKERLALVTMYLIGYNHYHSREPWTLQGLVDHLDLPAEPIQSLLTLLKEQGYLERTGDDPPGHLPARDIETIELSALVASVRRAEEGRLVREGRILRLDPVDGIMTKMQGAVDDALAGMTLRDLVLQLDREAG